MRLPTALLLCLLSAFAALAEDRFGPPPSRSVAAEAAANGFGAPAFDPTAALRWSRKAMPQDVASADLMVLRPRVLPDGLLNRTSASPVLRNRPMTTLPGPTATPGAYVGGPAFASPSPALAGATAPNAAAAPLGPANAAGQVGAPAAAQPMMREALSAPLPTSLFDDTAVPQPTLAASAVAAAAAPATLPRQMTGGQAVGANGEVGSRYYSVHRGYGVDADPIPMTQTGVGQ